MVKLGHPTWQHPPCLCVLKLPFLHHSRKCLMRICTCFVFCDCQTLCCHFKQSECIKKWQEESWKWRSWLWNTDYGSYVAPVYAVKWNIMFFKCTSCFYVPEAASLFISPSHVCVSLKQINSSLQSLKHSPTLPPNGWQYELTCLSIYILNVVVTGRIFRNDVKKMSSAGPFYRVRGWL